MNKPKQLKQISKIDGIGVLVPKWENIYEIPNLGKIDEISPNLGKDHGIINNVQNLLVRVQAISPQQNISMYNYTVDLFHKNLRYILKKAKIKQQDFCDILNASGLFKNIKPKVFSEKAETRRYLLRFNYFTTISYLVDVPLEIMLGIDLKEENNTTVNQ